MSFGWFKTGKSHEARLEEAERRFIEKLKKLKTHKSTNQGMVLDMETADRITLCNLKNQLEYLEEELMEHKQNGKWMHPEDVRNSELIYIPALKALIGYYGG